MSNELIFWVLIVVILIQLLALAATSNAIKTILKTKMFRDKLNILENKLEKKNKKNPLPIILIGIMIPALTNAADGHLDSSLGFEITTNTIYTMAMASGILLLLQWYLNVLFKNMFNIDQTEEDVLKAKELNKKDKVSIMRILTDAVPLEEEASVETDHEYDGIRELDNNLPPWWKYGFYISIVVAFIYFFNYHVFKISDLPQEAYQKEMVEAEKSVQEYLEAQALNVDENSVVFKNDPAVLKTGKSIFDQYCKVCHGGEGQGLVGPNFTDDYWLYGGSIKDIFKTVKYGAKNGMKSWKDELNPVQMQAVASFIKSLKGNTPENPKEPQGELYIEEQVTPADSASTVSQ
jgi:cytochrome c oxidase cbb3-type subunit 3